MSFAEYENQQNYLDLQNADYETFIRFITHPNIANKQQNNYDLDIYKKYPAKNWIDGDFNKLLAFYQRFFKESDKLWQTYSVAELDAMLQYILNGLKHGLDKLIYDSRLSFEKRQAVIESIYDLYAKLFIHDSIGHHRHMLWDGLAYSYSHGSFSYYLDKNDTVALQNVMFDTLTKILKIDCEACQNGALHGLNHLHHPDTETVIRQYLKSHPDLDEDDIAYAEACITGDMM
ncbi:hypothetical protein [Psychrobacter sp. FDAARGOS_221]|uniref:hypothetical protein n=1 Tax=Psychrobacter sp. FDAARGOS_221 TaxID=1975705 RepID=UPI000FD78F65|nr:hypothetical protein [Psychrobacter sp. FDAARGOS_221]